MFYFNKSKFIHKNGMYIFYDDGLWVNDVISIDSWSPVVSYLFYFVHYVAVFTSFLRYGPW